MIWTLLIIFQFKHFIADYLLQGKYMLGKFGREGWVLPLAAHCGVHWLFTFFMVNFALSWNHAILAFGVATLDFIVHFVMDRIKASPDLLGRYKALSAREFMAIANESREVSRLDDNSFDAIKFKIQAKHAIRSNTLFWWSLGLDQLVHHLTDLLIVFIIMKYLVV